MPRRIPRLDLLSRFIDLVGHDIVRLIDQRDGWPSIVEINFGQRGLVAALHLSGIYSSHRDRDKEEVRFQNPGQNRPIIAPMGSFPLLIGVVEQDHPVLAGMEVAHRIGKPSRQSLFVPVWALEQAGALGWAEKYNAKGELIVAFHPSLFQTYVEMRQSGLSLPADEIARGVAGITSDLVEGPIDRARRAATVAVRKASFSRKVIEAYENACAMCGLSLGLIQAAHIYPVGAPGSVDEVWNGIALCGNHHLAFDRHMIGIQPQNLRIEVHPTIQEMAAKSRAARLFIDATFNQAMRPRAVGSAPQDEMLRRRYDWFKGQYRWARIK